VSADARGAQLRIGVVGGGLVAQAMHLPYLLALPGFRLVALAEPSAVVREALGARYGVDRTHADWRSLLDAGGLDAVLVASPAATHADVVVAALELGLHVFCEKPLALTLRDVDRILAARDHAGRVVQVGYMKRHDPAYGRLLDDLDGSADELRYVSVVVNDPEWVPYFAEGEVLRGRDVPAALVERTRRAEAAQVEEAVGAGDPDTVRAFSDGYLGSLVHHVNVVHGVLERLGQPVPPRAVASAWWAGGSAITASAQLADGARWDSAWIQLTETREHREAFALFFSDSVRRLTFPSPWLKASPTRYERGETRGAANVVTRFEGYEQVFRRELEHFHECCLGAASCRTPPEQARADTVLLTDLFLASRER
jgi:predicted dehydrogenase